MLNSVYANLSHITGQGSMYRMSAGCLKVLCMQIRFMLYRVNYSSLLLVSSSRIISLHMCLYAAHCTSNAALIVFEVQVREVNDH